MDIVKLEESMDSLQGFADKTTEAISGIEKKLSEIKIDDGELLKTALAEIKEEQERQKKLQETLIIMVKGKWHDTEPEKDRAYRFGKMIQSMHRAHFGGVEARTYLEKIGCRLNTATGAEADWKTSDWIMGAGEKSALGTVLRGDATTGSYLIPQEFAAEVLRVAALGSAMMGKVRKMPMTVRKITFPASVVETSFTWPADESTAKTEKNPTFTKIDLEAKTAAGWITITEEFNEDSLVPMGEYFRDLFGEAWGTEFDKQCLVANSAPFKGVLYASSVNNVVMESGKIQFDDMDADDLLLLLGGLTSRAKRLGAVYMMHPTILDVIRKIKNATGDYIYQRPGNGVPGTIWGYPYIESDAMPALSDTAISTPFIAFGNPRNIIHGDRLGMEFKVFPDTSYAVEYDQIFFRCRLRQAFVVGIPGAFSRLVTAAV